MSVEKAAPTSPGPSEAFVSRSLVRIAVRETLSRWGARLGLFWIGLVALSGIFAPFLASSHPIVLKQEGRWSSPMLEHLTFVDVSLVLLFFLGLFLILLRWVCARVRWWIFVMVGSGIVGISYLTISPPTVVWLPKYRVAEENGQVQYVLRTLVPYSPTDRFSDLREPTQNLPPGRRHWLGTTPNGEDVLSRMMHASRIAVSIGFVSTGIAFVIGVVVGALMGYFSGVVDIIGMRLIEIFEAIPTLFLLITLVALYGRDLYMMMVIIGLTGWTGNARFMRAEYLRLRKMDFVQAAVALGLPLRSILFRHMLPNGITPVLISASFGVASAILAESTLSFLGLGLIDQASWGQMLDQARGVGTDFYWWMAVFPGGAIFLTVFAYNMIGEALRDALDPRLLKREA
ncbi:MAG: hypothetical protein KatS3mg104_1356 [Phycisphaerae bacterium]|jgi:peptide/nickel transport system permease protein|nr:MAG: hypothetical protein KatS3mg104_1356 [Phycisphaerae bacterium]